MRIAQGFTAYNRPNYLDATLNTWADARLWGRIPVFVYAEPSTCQMPPRDRFEATRHPSIHFTQNDHRYGVLSNIHRAYAQTFVTSTADFVFCGEDDLLVSDDIVEYFLWAAEEFRDDPSIAAVCAGQPEPLRLGGDPGVNAAFKGVFQGSVWGTWRDRWDDLISPTWDHSYSTGEGDHRGYDWNLMLRVLPEANMQCIRLFHSRTDHIGVHGTHGTPDNFRRYPTWQAHREPAPFTLVG